MTSINNSSPITAARTIPGEPIVSRSTLHLEKAEVLRRLLPVRIVAAAEKLHLRLCYRCRCCCLRLLVHLKRSSHLHFQKLSPSHRLGVKMSTQAFSSTMITQILYLNVPPDQHLDQIQTHAGSQWSKALDLVTASQGLLRLYWGRRLEEPRNVQLHLGRTSPTPNRIHKA